MSDMKPRRASREMTLVEPAPADTGNAAMVGDRYAELLRLTDGAASRPGDARGSGDTLADRLDGLARAGGLPRTLREAGVDRADLSALAADAATQWTGTFNPRPFDAAAALELYERAL